MVVYGGPDIVTDGLVLCLDAGNSKSYPGSGTSWFDLSGNGNTGTLTNGPIYNSDNGGTIVFDGINDSIESFPQLISGSGSRSIGCFFKANNTIRMTLADTRNNNTAVGWGLVINRSAGHLTYFHSGGSIVEIQGGISSGLWYGVNATYDVSSATVCLYVNGRIIGSPVSSITPISVYGYNGAIGKSDSTFSNFFNGNIAQVIMHNRALSATEVAQNYNATKGRFGL